MRKDGGAKAPTPKREMVARLKAERAAQGIFKRSIWLTDERYEKVKEFLKQI
jgi:hypothetical protein